MITEVVDELVPGGGPVEVAVSPRVEMLPFKGPKDEDVSESMLVAEVKPVDV